MEQQVPASTAEASTAAESSGAVSQAAAGPSDAVVDPALSKVTPAPTEPEAAKQDPPSTTTEPPQPVASSAPPTTVEKPKAHRAISLGPIREIPPWNPAKAAAAQQAAASGSKSSPSNASLPTVRRVSQPPPAPPNLAAPALPQSMPSPLVQPGPSSGATTPNGQASGTYRPLNVRDALTYLDEVKLQFHTQPGAPFLCFEKQSIQQLTEVYNRFLDIMKDFKTQNIDTPGVIDRVSSLFRGHAALIQGFNTFLPPGYRIECSIADDPSAVSTITVLTPSGTLTRSLPGSSANLTAAQRINGAVDLLFTPQADGAARPAAAAVAGPSSNSNHLALPPPDVTQMPSVVTPGAASVLGGMSSQQNTTANRPPLEFNHAISYVNKIKQRYVSDPQTYKIFLEILQTYQKEQRPIQEVYRQVTQLFAGATDLLDEFKQFLPDNSEQATMMRPAHYFEDAATVRGESARDAAVSRRGQTLSQVASSRAAARENAGATKKRSSKYVDPVLAAAPPPKAIKRTKHTGHRGGSPPAGGRWAGETMSYRATITPAEARQQADAAAMARIHLLGLPGAPLTSSEELAFFDRAKKFLDDRPTYQEFLKLLNLFTAEIIDLPTLVNEAYVFLGESDELFAQFKELVGWDSAVDGLVDDEEWIVDNVNALERPKFDVASLKFFPPSYRRLPQHEIDLACSGRDALCWSVLNDEWFSHRTWSSEYSGAHRKSVYEDVLAIAEQERHWFDYQIQVLARAIAAFEPVLMRIDRMSPEERATFKLEKGLGGGHTASVYERAIRKIYGADREQTTHVQFRSDHCTEIIKALYDNPVAAVPTILRRLKQKDEEWRKARREWNRMWREVDVLNWYRSLDHQGQPFKVSDRRYIQPKSLVREIDDLRMTGHKKVVGIDGDESLASTRHQFEFYIGERDIFFDTLKLFLGYLDRVSGSSISVPEKDRCETFLRAFIQLIFNMTSEELEAGIGTSQSRPESSTSSVSNRKVAVDLGAANGAGDDDSEMEVDERIMNRPSDLRRHLLAGTVELNGGSAANSRAVSPTDSEALPLGAEGVSEDTEEIADLGSELTWIKVQKEPWSDGEPVSSPMRSRNNSDNGSIKSDSSSRPITRRYNFFCGTTHYAIIRLLHLIYHRLCQVKRMAKEVADNYQPRLSSFAVELGLASELPIIDVAEDGSDNPAHAYYQHTLHLCEEFFEGSRDKEGFATNKMDAATFEEQLRLMYGIKAYWLFTIDKLMSALLKYIHISNSDLDLKSRSLIELLKKDRAAPQQTLRQQIAWRMQAEEIVGRVYEGKDAPPPEALYKIEWLPEQNIHTVQLLGPDDLTLDDAFDSDDRWEYYRSSYALTAPTEGIGAGVSAPLLRRNRDAVTVATDNSAFETRSALDVAFGRSSYKMRWSAGSGSSLVRKMTERRTRRQRDAEQERVNEVWERKNAGFQSKLDFLVGADSVDAMES